MGFNSGFKGLNDGSARSQGLYNHKAGTLSFTSQASFETATS